MQRSGLIIYQQARRSTIKHAVNVHAYTSIYPMGVIGSPSSIRPIHTTKALSTSRDHSTIDFAYMPQHELEQPASTTVLRMPLLPNNYTSKRNSSEKRDLMESVIRPEISTVSANGTHIDNPSAMSDVVDNHSADMDPFDLTTTVTNAASRVAGVSRSHLKKEGAMSQLWAGLVDDMFGSRQPSKA